MDTPPYKWTATQALDFLKNDAISVEAYAQSLLDRILERDRTIKAWAHLGKHPPENHLIYFNQLLTDNKIPSSF